MKKKMKTPLEVFAAPTTTGQLVKAWRKILKSPRRRWPLPAESRRQT